jgi:hypothetical protein
MGLLSLVYGTKKKLSIAQIEVDVAVAETHETNCDITENPVEAGANVSDHVFFKPVMLTVEGLVSDTPVKFLAGLTSLFDDNRSRKTYEELLALQEDREPVDVITGLKQYNNMILKTLTVPRSADTGRALRFTAVFQEVRIVESATISIQVSASSFQSKSSLGKVTGGAPASKVSDDGASIMSKWTGLR